MSGPFRFNQQPAQSPLERAASPFSSAQQSVSYKTNVNRSKTRKWVEAKKNAYDGDDWGDYDEYDEYGVDESPQPEPAPLSSPRYYAQRPVYDTPTRSFTDPAQQLPLPKPRKNSFDAGEEQRSFSASIPHPHQQGYAQQPSYQPQPQPPPQQPSPLSPLQTSTTGQHVAGTSPQNRDFSPATMPPPTRSSTGPADVHSSPSNTQFPPRKSSIGQGSAPLEPIDFITVATSPRERTGSQDKPLPFIRPADIYKRVEEERRRESMDSSRPSLDALSPHPKDEPSSPVTDRRNLQPLETVAERKSEYLPDLDVGQQPEGKSEPQRPQHDRVPSALKGISTFDNDFWSSGPDLQAPASHAPVVSPPQDQGLRSIVDQAFTRTDEQRSVPPTPISKDSGSELDRSNTGSTSGISPIMSRVPSGATSVLKIRGLGDGSTPVIAEEPHEAGTPVSRPTSGHFPHASQGHTRNVSNTSIPRTGLATPTRGDSPARSPALGPQRTLIEPEVAQITTESPTDAMEGGFSGPNAAYATREADIATAVLNSPVRAAPELGAAERQSQDAFLESHHAQSPIRDALPRDRSESPSKGRVQALAGKFGEVSQSRRGSTQSDVSRNSVQSWERSQNNSRAPSPTKGNPGKPSSPKKEFRPHLPGGWESYAITTPAPIDRSEADAGLGVKGNNAPSALALADQAQSGRGLDMATSDIPPALADIDLTPTTTIRQAAEVKSPPTFDPISALKDAGAAMTESLRTTVGLGGPPASEQESQGRRSHGDMYLPRPLHMERTSSAMSSIPPTPPAKDTPESEFPPTPPLKEHFTEPITRPERPTMVPQLSSYPSADDQESDRLRKEIVASLSPLRMSIVPATEPDNNSLRPDSKGADHASSILDSYYAELEKDSPRHSDELGRDIPKLAPLKSVSSASFSPPQKAATVHRYSWEADGSQSPTPEKQSDSATTTEPKESIQTEKDASPTIKHVMVEKKSWNEGIPDNPYFGPGHTITVTKPDPLTDAELAARANTPPPGSELSLTSPPPREHTRSPGLHIVNSAVDPEAVDLPPRWGAEHAAQSPSEVEKVSSPQQLEEQQDTNPAISAHTALTGSIEAPEPSVVHEPDVKSPTSPKSPTSDKPLGAREIATIGSAADRIATYNKTRDQWATTDHGLSDWITATFEADPSLAVQGTQPLPQPRPQSGTFRHKHTASLAMLGKFTGSSNNQSSSGAYYEQYNSAAAQVPTSSNSPTAGPSKTSSGFLGRTASHSIQTQQMQAKGKDLLHTAGVLSGKGMTSAKGLFAKGKSRFNRDKDSAHSRDASRELESTSSPTTTENMPITEVADESRRRRRFSSPFRRSRSRPRSVSAVLPSTVSLISTGSVGTPTTDVPDIPKAFQGRPHSYHAPDLGMHPAYRGSTDQLTPTLPFHERGRAGVHPSPTRASFVSETEVQDDFVPPVPPIPAGLDGDQRGRRRRSWGNASLTFQSNVRHATPPAKSSRSLGASPIVTNFDVHGRKASQPYSTDAPPHAPWTDDGHPNPGSPRTRHSTPITKGLWMGDTSPVLSKRMPATADNNKDIETHQPILPVHTDGIPVPAELVHLSQHDEDSNDAQLQGPSENRPSETTREKLVNSPTRSVNRHSIPWPGTLLDTTKTDEQQTKRLDEVPAPQAFAMQFSGDISPLLRSSKASLEEVSDGDVGTPGSTDEWGAQQERWEDEGVRGAGEASGGEERTPGPLEGLQASDAGVADSQGMVFEDKSKALKDKHHDLASYETETIGIGDVSPGSDTGTHSAKRASTQVLDVQSALESKLVGADDVSPVSARSPVFIATSSKDDEDQTQVRVIHEKPERPSTERFYTASIGPNLEHARGKASMSNEDEEMVNRPRIERFETAQDEVQGPGELTIPTIRQPASRYATVMASEPVASYREYSGSSSGSSDDQVEVRPVSSSALTPQRAELRADAAMPIVTRRVSASQLQVVHAVEEYAASNSSLSSWDQDSNAADAISEPGTAAEMKDESDLVTPVAQVPRTAPHEQQVDQAAMSNSSSLSPAYNGYFGGQSAPQTHETLQQPDPTSSMTVPERSKSLLSIISSAVSSTAISPASSNAGRSTPSTIHRMQCDFSNAKKNNLTDEQIPEEPTSAKEEQVPAARHDEYDLYADHNGVVKDVHDENGQPLRVAPTPNLPQAQLARTATEASSVATVPDTPSSRSRRYSFGRPMSFISGPEDDDGRPQDQINQPMAGGIATPPIPSQSKQRSRQYQSISSGAIYSDIAPVQDIHWPPGEVISPPPVKPVQQEPAPVKVVRQPTRFVPHGHIKKDEAEGEELPVQQTRNLPPQRAAPSIPPQRLNPDGDPLSERPNGNLHTQNRRIDGETQVQPGARSVSAPMQHMSIPGLGARVVSQPLGPSSVGPTTAPRDEFEYQQQTMQLQAKYPRFRGAENQGLNMQQLAPGQQDAQVQGKALSKPGLAAAIKGIVGRTSPNAPYAPNVPPVPSHLAPMAPIDASRAESFVSAVSSLTRERATSIPSKPSSTIAAPQRPSSRGGESHYSHVSHASMQVQPAQSRQDLTMPVMLIQHQTSYLQPQQLLAPAQSAQSQNYRASTGNLPDPGKKKRFSAFTGLFGKGNAAADLQGKLRLSREEKKAQKAQRHTSQPIPQSPPAQQWPPPHTHYVAPQQSGVPYGPSQQFPTVAHAVQPTDRQFNPAHAPSHLQGAPDVFSQGMQQAPLHPQAQPQQRYPQQQQKPTMPPDEGSAYSRTKRMAEEHRARATSHPVRPVFTDAVSIASDLRLSAEQPQHLLRQSLQKPPMNGYYYPEKPSPPLEQGAYRASLDERQRAQQLRQQPIGAEQRSHADLPRSTRDQRAFSASAVPHEQTQQQHQRHPSMEPGAYGASQAARQQVPQLRPEPGSEQGAYGVTHEERMRMQHQPLPKPEAFGRSQIHYDQMQQHRPPQQTNIPSQNERQQIPPHQQQPAMSREEHMRQAEHELSQHRWQQQQIQLRQFHMQQQAQIAQQQALNPQSVSGPPLSQASPPASPGAQHHEPQYDTPPIPGAYDPVKGVFVSPPDRQQHAFSTPDNHASRHESDPQMQPISPQVSGQSQIPPNVRHHSDASTVSVVSPIQGPTPEPPAAGPAADQRPHKPRMPSISEVHQKQPDLPWHMNFPAGTTEQDIVRARQKQFFQQQFASQQQAQAERHASSPSPRVSPDKPSPPFPAPLEHPQEQGGGFREVLPRTSPQPYPAPQSAPLERPSHNPQPAQQAQLRPQEGQGWPLRTSSTPPQPTVGLHSPPTEPYTPRRPGSFDQRRHEPHPPNERQRLSPLNHQIQYDDNVPDEAPPSYDGPGVPNEGMEKSNPYRPRPPNIVTIPNEQSRHQDVRPRQASLGLMQHPQPASMAASPQRTAPDMGADSLRRQMLQQEEHARMERIQRSQMQAAQRLREQQERDAARARARELERSVSGGGRVGSLRSVRGSHNGGMPGWERRGLQGGNSRPVFELPALDDEEPVMRATSFPGQEWVPPMYVDD